MRSSRPHAPARSATGKSSSPASNRSSAFAPGRPTRRRSKPQARLCKQPSTSAGAIAPPLVLKSVSPEHSAQPLNLVLFFVGPVRVGRPAFNALQQYHDCATAAIGRTRLTKCKHVAALGQPACDFAPQHRFAVFRAETFSV